MAAAAHDPEDGIYDVIRRKNYHHTSIPKKADRPNPGQPQWETKASAHKIDYADEDYIITTVPPAGDADGSAECLLTGWAKRTIFTTPGFPAPIARPAEIKYAVRKAKGKGLGLFATGNYEAGELVLAERPLVVQPVWGMAPRAPGAELSQKDVRGAAFADAEYKLGLLSARMAPADLRRYKALADCHARDGMGPLYGVCQTNCRDVGDALADPVGAAAVGPVKNQYCFVGDVSSRPNHSCCPNVIRRFDLRSFAVHVYAVRPLAVGEELVAAYVPPWRPGAERRDHFKTSWHFVCKCMACTDRGVTDEARAQVLGCRLPRTSEGPASADKALLMFEALGLQYERRYVKLVRRVAKILRGAGNVARADMLDGLADRLLVAHGVREEELDQE